MITERHQEQASLYVLGGLTDAEQQAFDTELRANAELREFVFGLQRTTGLLAMAAPYVPPPRELKDKILRRLDSTPRQEGQPAYSQPDFSAANLPGLRFLIANDRSGWKQLPVRGAWIKLLSLDRERGYAVMLGKLEPGVRYPAHANVGPEDLYVLTGDLHIGDQPLQAGDFHHADAGSWHSENYSVEGCTLLAVLTADHPLVEYAVA